jgi:transcriptional regulator with XRE-family HTH domain
MRYDFVTKTIIIVITSKIYSMHYNFGQAIRKIRLAKNIKQEELAYHLQIKQSTLSKMENGKHNISLEIIINIANYTKSSIHEFFTNDLHQLEQLNFKLQLQELHDELRVQKENNKQLINIINDLEKKSFEKPPPHQTSRLNKFSTIISLSF